MEPNLFHHSSGPTDGLLAAMGARHAGSANRSRPATADAQPSIKASSGRPNFQIAIRDIHSPLQFLADAGVIVLLGITAGVGYQLLFRGVPGAIIDFGYTGLVVAILFAAVSRLSAGQRAVTLTNSFDRVSDVAWSWTLAFAGLVFILFALKAGSSTSRGAVLSFYLIGLPAVSVWRVFTPIVIAPFARKAGYASHNCILIGDVADPLLERFAVDFQANGHTAPTVLKFRAACLPSLWAKELKSLAMRVADTARSLGPGEIYVCAGAIPSDRLSAVGRVLSIVPRAIFVVPDAQTASLVRCKPACVGPHIALEIRREPLGPAQRAIKRTLDMTGAALALLLAAPLFILIALAIKCSSPGPVFFRQTRNGYRGKPFKIIKFRSMCVLEDGPSIQQARRDDPRVTKVGKFLRKSSLDELPQLINILLGQMSLVGPRPHAQAHDELYASSIENYEVRQHVKPGLTGWAQVNGLRGETATLDAMYRRIEFDLWYAVNASVLLDIEILVRTAIEVCRHRNAY